MKATDALEKMAGTYTGSWDYYGVDAQGSVVKLYSTTDVAIASEMKLEKDRAYLSIRNRIQLPDGKDLNLEFQEGYLLNPDGSAGHRYFEAFGQRVVEEPLGEHAWAYQTPAAPQELERIGFPPASVISASHVTVKTEVITSGAETQLVSRLTTVQWKDASGKARVIQFVSMSGSHTRPLPAATR